MPAVVESATFPQQLAMNNPAGASAPSPGTPADQIASKVDASVVAVARPDPAPSNPSPQAPRPVGWWVRDAELHAKIAAGAADDLGLVWVKNKGYPWWPARRVDEVYHDQVNPAARRPPGPCDAYQYFGSIEYQWILPSCPRLPIQSFSEGWKHGHWALSKRQALMAGVGDACAFTVDPSRIPVGFFDHVPTPEPTPEKAKARSKPRRKGPSDTTNQPPRKRSKTDAADGEENAKPPKPPTKRELAARAKAEKEAARLAAEAAKPKIKWPLLTSLTVFPRSADFATPAVSEFTLPFDVRREGKPPRYDRVNRSVWVSSAAPRPFPRDEVEACLCQPAPEVAVAMLAARETAEAAAAAKREAKANAAAAAAANAASDETGSANAEAGADASLVKSAEGAARDASGAAVVALARTGCGAECFNRSCRTTCDPRVCPCGPSCSNRPFHLLTSPKTRIVLTEHRGWGLFVTEPVRAGRFVVEYTGEIIDDKTTEQRLWEDKKRGEDNFYLMEVSNNQIIDARLKGNLSRFINSSCHPNCETQKWQDASTGETRVGIFAVKDIAAGEELTYDYNFAHFGGEGTTSFTCMCGHPLCRGTLDANPERTRNYGRRLKIQWGDDEFFPGQVLSYHNKTEKYLVLYDSGEQEHVKLEGEGAPKYRWLSPPTRPETEKKPNDAERAGDTKDKSKGKGKGKGKDKAEDAKKRARLSGKAKPRAKAKTEVKPKVKTEGGAQ